MPVRVIGVRCRMGEEVFHFKGHASRRAGPPWPPIPREEGLSLTGSGQVSGTNEEHLAQRGDDALALEPIPAGELGCLINEDKREGETAVARLMHTTTSICFQSASCGRRRALGRDLQTTERNLHHTIISQFGDSLGKE